MRIKKWPLHTLWVLALSVQASFGEQDGARDAADRFVELRDAYVTQYRPLWQKAAVAWWEASTTGTDEAFDRKKKADNAIVEFNSNAAFFAKIKALRDSGEVRDPGAARELDVIYRTLLPAQADKALQKRIIDLEARVEQVFNTHRSLVDGKRLTENDVREILRSTHDSDRAKAAWTGYVSVGAKAADTLRQLAKLRNEMARKLGYRDFYAMRLFLQEIDEMAFFKLFDELDTLTRPPFQKLKKQLDAERAKRFGVKVAELKPWHYGDIFFQESPGGSEVDLDSLFANADMLALARKYYDSIDLSCDDVIARSDLYEKEGKSPHAFCADLDREGDIRVLCNMKPNLYWSDTLLHELGHAVYDKYIDERTPFLLRTPSHAITTEGIALMFGAMVKNEDWLVRVRGLDPKEAAPAVKAAREALRQEKIIFSRWTQVMVRFERALYADPDQDLARLWWDLKKQYQLINPPNDMALPGFAAKVHVLTDPVYYHSYLMGDVFAAQVQAYVAREILKSKDPLASCFAGKPEVGAYLREKVFGPGNLYSWNDLTRRATGEDLTARYFVEQYLK